MNIFRLISSGTIEEKVYQRQIFKHMLTKRILVDPRQSQSFSTRDLKDLFTLSEGESSPLTCPPPPLHSAPSPSPCHPSPLAPLSCVRLCAFQALWAMRRWTLPLWI